MSIRWMYHGVSPSFSERHGAWKISLKRPAKGLPYLQPPFQTYDVVASHNTGVGENSWEVSSISREGTRLAYC